MLYGHFTIKKPIVGTLDITIVRVQSLGFLDLYKGTTQHFIFTFNMSNKGERC